MNWWLFKIILSVFSISLQNDIYPSDSPTLLYLMLGGKDDSRSLEFSR